VTLTADQAFADGLGLFGSVVDKLGPDDWDRASACAGWTVLDVLGHLGTAVEMGISVLHGEQPTWREVTRPAEHVAGDPLTHWQVLEARARAALVGADLDLEMDTPMGPRTVADRLAFPAIDLYVHAWDVGAPCGVTVELPAEVIDFAHTQLDPFPAEMMRGDQGAFGPEVPAPSDATPSEAFLAWTGRAPR
jgi:uncharacterized protein (TIGR03086 family)